MAASLRTSERARMKAANMPAPVDETHARTERIARYKEERRRQLAAQYSASSSSGKDSPAGDAQRRYISRDDKGCVSEPLKNIRTTRTSRLRAAAATGTPSPIPTEVKSAPEVKSRIVRKTSKLESSDLSSSSAPSSEVPSREGTPQYVSPSVRSTSSHKSEKDKSSKRKSNLNRCLTEEPVAPSSDSTTDDNTTGVTTRRRKINSATRTISMVANTAPTSSLRGVQRSSSVSQTSSNIQPPSTVFQRLQCNVRPSTTSTSTTNVNRTEKRTPDPSPARRISNDTKLTPNNNTTAVDVSKRVDALLARTKDFETRIDRLATTNNNSSNKKPINLTSKMSSSKLLPNKNINKKNTTEQSESIVINNEPSKILTENDGNIKMLSSTDKISSELKNEHPKLPLNEVIINQVSKIQDCFTDDVSDKRSSDVSSSNDEVTFTVTLKSNHKQDLYIDEEKLLKTKTPSPPKDKSLIKNKSPSPPKEIITLPSKVKSPSPTKEKSPTPSKEKSPPPSKEKSPTPTKEKSPPPSKEKSPTPTKEKSPSPSKEKSPTPTKEKSPPTNKEMSPSPSKSPLRKVSSLSTMNKKPTTLPVKSQVKTTTSPIKSPLRTLSSPIKSPITKTTSKSSVLRKSPEKVSSPITNKSNNIQSEDLDELLLVLKDDNNTLSNGHHDAESSETTEEMKSAISSPVKSCESPVQIIEPKRKTSILKSKKSIDETISSSSSSSITNTTSPPISILKHNDNNINSSNMSTVINNITETVCMTSSSRPQSILKKRSSLEENSCSQDEDTCINTTTNTSTTRRRVGSDDILEQEQRSFSPEPQGILKRKSNSIGETAKPILKKKSFEDLGDEPRPILKKKSSTDEDMDIINNININDKPKPILKSGRKSVEGDDGSNYSSAAGSPARRSPCLLDDAVIRNQVALHLRFATTSEQEETRDSARTARHSDSENEEDSQPPRLPEEEERRPSVSERAQLFMRLSELHRQSANPSPRQKETARRERAKRFSTQPVTSDEVDEARGQLQSQAIESKSCEVEAGPSNVQNSGSLTSLHQPTPVATGAGDEDDEEPSQLSLAERVRLFNEKIKLQATTPPPLATVIPRRRSVRRSVTSTRFRTLPVTDAEVEQLVSPLAATFIKPPDPGVLGGMSARAAREAMFEHATKTLGKSTPSPASELSDNVPDSRPKGILKHSSSVPPPKQPLPPLQQQQQQISIDDDEDEEESDIVRGILKIPASSITQARLNTSSNSNVKSAMKKESSFDDTTPRSILKPQSIEKSDSSSSEDDIIGVKEDLASILHNVSSQHSNSGQNIDMPLLPSSAAASSSDECDTSSSGGREVKTIIGYISEQRSSVNIQSSIKQTFTIKDQCEILEEIPEPVIDVQVHQSVRFSPEPSSADITPEIIIKPQELSEILDPMIKVSSAGSSESIKKRSPVTFDPVIGISSSDDMVKSSDLPKIRSPVKFESVDEVSSSDDDIVKSSDLPKVRSPVKYEPVIEVSLSDDKKLETSESLKSPVQFEPMIELSPSSDENIKSSVSPKSRSPVKFDSVIKTREDISPRLSPRTPSPIKDRTSPVKQLSPLAERIPTSPSPTRSRPQSLAGDKNSMSIAERLAALKQSGETEWKKRVTRTSPDREITTTNGTPALKPLQTSASMPGSTGGILAEKLNLLDKASNDWKKRVGPNDAVEFSVAGRMGIKQTSPLASPINQAISSDRKKKTPKPARFRSKAAGRNENKSQPSSPHKDLIAHALMRSISAPEARPDDVQMVEVPSPDNETFSQFFSSNLTPPSINPPQAAMEVEIADFEEFSQHTLLVTHKRTVKMQRRRLGSRNPVKALAARTDLVQEYQEVRTGAAEREMKRLNVEKLAKNSNLAVEALAGLASKEDFTAVALKKATSSPVGSMLPYSDLMLLQIKGRRHVQTRLVEPVAQSINHGDSYILVTPTTVYNWLGKLSNVIERTRSAEVALQISQRKDLGCAKAAGNVITIDESKVACSGIQRRAFWRLLGVEDGDGKACEAGHPDEDEGYENSVTDTNMVYIVDGDELVPLEKFWGALPRIEMLDPSKVLVFDFGSELYVWSGKNAGTDARKAGVSLARELWESGIDYSECDLSPLGSDITGSRPTWALLGKLNQHMETALFREKFLDWPEFSRVIRVKEKEGDDKQVDGSIEVLPCNVEELLGVEWSEPDIELEGSHLGRGDSYFDEETHRQFEIATSGVTMWHVEEFGCHELPQQSVGQFHCNDSYVVRWSYSVTVTGRELSGAPSRHAMTGRSRCAYFFWQGSHASLNEQGAAALLTVELDREQGPQVRVVQGSEPAAFLRLFHGNMTVHTGHREPDEENDEQIEEQGPWRLYIVRTGSHLSETCLVQVPCSMRQLRSRTSLLLINTESGTAIVWHGSQSHSSTKTAALAALENINKERALEFGISEDLKFKIKEIREGAETDDFFAGLGGSNRQLYVSLPPSKSLLPMRLFHLSSASGTFVATEILSPAKSKDPPQAFPFLQHELYDASQPALFLLDAGCEMWLWQGWWSEDGGEEAAGSGAVRWQAERRAAMQTALDYWQQTHKGESVEASLVWAGLEPLSFINLFPHWIDRDDAAECNIQDGHKPGEVLSIEDELARLTRSTYPPAQLLQRPLPDGVDPTRLEDYLAPQHFEELLGMSKEEFLELPTWKQGNIKKEIGLF